MFLFFFPSHWTSDVLGHRSLSSKLSAAPVPQLYGGAHVWCSLLQTPQNHADIKIKEKKKNDSTLLYPSLEKGIDQCWSSKAAVTLRELIKRRIHSSRPTWQLCLDASFLTNKFIQGVVSRACLLCLSNFNPPFFIITPFSLLFPIKYFSTRISEFMSQDCLISHNNTQS